MDGKLLFVLTVMTSRMLLPGVPANDKGKTEAVKPNEITKQVKVALYGNEKQINSITCGLPAGLKSGEMVKCAVVGAKPNVKTSNADDDFFGPAEEVKTDKNKSVNWDDDETATPPASITKVKSYFGSSGDIPDGQPLLVSSDKFTQFIRNTANLGGAVKNSNNMPLIAAWSSNKLADSTSPVGQYSLNWNTATENSISVEQKSDFMPPVQVIEPVGKCDFSKSVKVAWKPVSGATMYHVAAYGNTGGSTVVWTSNAQQNACFDLATDVVTESRIPKILKFGALLPPDATSCIIPKGVFKGAPQVTISVAAVGPDVIITEDLIDTKILLRSITDIVLTNSAKPSDDKQDAKPKKKKDFLGQIGDTIHKVIKKEDEVHDVINDADRAEDRADNIDHDLDNLSD